MGCLWPPGEISQLSSGTKGLCASCPAAGGLPLCSEVASSLALWSHLPPYLVRLTACSPCSVARTGIFGFLPVLAVQGFSVPSSTGISGSSVCCVGCGGAEVCSLIPHRKLQQVHFFCQMIIWLLVCDRVCDNLWALCCNVKVTHVLRSSGLNCVLVKQWPLQVSGRAQPRPRTDYRN